MEVSRVKSFFTKRNIWLIVIFSIITIILVRCVSNSRVKPDHTSKLRVLASVAKTSKIPVLLPALGTVTPVISVTVRTQVNGQLISVLFTEGQFVKAGDLLAEIDPQPFEAILLQNKGQLERDQALLANAIIDLQRYTTLWKQDSVAKQQLDTQASLVKQYQGTILNDQGLVKSAQVNLAFTKITAPFAGRIGLRLVDPGNFAQTTDANGIAVINQFDPIEVVFTLPEDNVTDVVRQMNAHKTLPVFAFDRSQVKLLATGKLMTIDNQIDPTTGTVKLKAIFNNSNSLLFPNQFVNIKMLVNIIPNAIIIPTAAIQRGSIGNFVYLVIQDKVKVQPITTTITYGANTIVTKGIKPGDQVVTEGADKLTEGAAVTVYSDTNNPVKATKTGVT